MSDRDRHLRALVLDDGPVKYDQEKRETAADIEQQNPHWHVDWGVGSHRFHAYPRFAVPRGTWASSSHEKDLVAQMRRIEWNSRARQQGADSEPRGGSDQALRPGHRNPQPASTVQIYKQGDSPRNGIGAS